MPRRCSSRRTTRPWARPAASARCDVSEMPRRVEAPEGDRRDDDEPGDHGGARAHRESERGNARRGERHADRQQPPRAIAEPPQEWVQDHLDEPGPEEDRCDLERAPAGVVEREGVRTMRRPKSIAGSMFSHKPPRKR